MNLYKGNNATKFSNTRSNPWDGWSRAIKQLEIRNAQLKILDLGCGNGRFLEFLISKHPNTNIKYLGLDNSEELLEIAKDTVSTFENVEAEFKYTDLNSNWNVSQTGYDLIVSFGVLHHLEDTSHRSFLINNSLELLKDAGILCVTFWKFKDDEKFFQKHLLKDLGDNNYLLSFASSAERFCHYSDQSEIDNLVDQDLVLDHYFSDGKNNEMNEYFLLQKKHLESSLIS